MPSALLLLGACGGGDSAADSVAVGASTRAPAPVVADSVSVAPKDTTPTFRGVGNEPGWLVTISDSLLVLRWDYDEKRAEVPTPVPDTTPQGRRYQVTTGPTPFTVVIRDVRCTDGMSGRAFPARVQVLLGTRTLDGCGGDPIIGLRDGEWRVDSLDGRPIQPDSRITLTFGEDGRVVGSASCNSYIAGYTMAGDTLTLEPAVATRRACSPPLDAQEQAFLALLQGTQPFRITGNRTLVIGTPGPGEGRRWLTARVW